MIYLFATVAVLAVALAITIKALLSARSRVSTLARTTAWLQRELATVKREKVEAVEAHRAALLRERAVLDAMVAEERAAAASAAGVEARMRSDDPGDVAAGLAEALEGRR
jgi:hypothetical protein